MTKEQWLEEAQKALENQANSAFNIHNWLGLIECFMERHEEVVFTARNGKQYSLSEIIKNMQKSMDKMSQAHTTLAELSKGLIHSVPEDMKINDKMSLFE